eukprot:7135723-Pyramimonas_sp.AAC.1
MRVQQVRGFAVLKSQELLSGAISDGQNATVRLILSVGVPRIIPWRSSGSSNDAVPSVGMNSCSGRSRGSMEG